MLNFIDRPWPGILLFIVLAFIDYPLTVIARSSYQKYMSRYVHYQTVKSIGRSKFGLFSIIMKILIGVMLYGVWFIYRAAELRIAGVLFLWLLGFAIGSYLIINIRHLESILLSRLYTRADLVDGRILYHPNFSLRISAIQFFSIMIIFCLFAIILPGYFTLGLACASLFLVIRNLLLASGQRASI